MTMQNHMDMKKTALVLGATGGIGGAVARGLSARGWQVVAMNRDPEKAASRLPDFLWVKGDAMNATDVLRAAQGVSVIVHAVNPPGYVNWGKLVLPMIDNTVAAAKAVGARIVLPGTIYNFGPDTFPQITEESPQHPTSVKGGIRVEMERRLQMAAGQGVPVIIVRAGDYFGPQADSSWFSQGLVKAGKPVASVTYPGKPGIGHQWAYVPDVAETMIRLLEQGDSLPVFAVYHMRGFWDADGRQMVASIERVACRPLKRGSFPWWLLPLAAPFVGFMRELREMRYLWSEPLQMPNSRLVAAIGEEPQTPVDIAVRATLESMGSL
ncbi:SDR family oxidoreductase [Rhizobium tumorigenes]|uniref:SDR family oxidoreductase n=1 Tax=Rhizobium tumorigenes TaxID=2041385 RepID=UPI003BF965B6